MEFEKRRGDSKTIETGSRLMGPDWSSLPPELVQLISEKITNMDHYVYFRLVCWPWRRACIPNPRHLIPQIPWLWVDLSEKIPPSVFPLTLSLYDFSKSRMHNFDLPGVSLNDVRGHSHGWIVLEKDKELSFINPITKEVKSGCFPSLAAPPTILGFAKNENKKNCLYLENFNPGIVKAILTKSPSDMDCIVVAEFQKGWELGFARIGDTSWTILKLKEHGRGSRRMCDFKCRNESIYVINDKGCLIFYDLRDLSQKIVIKSLTYARGYHQLRLVFGEGELFDGVPIIVKHNTDILSMFEVFKCENEAKGCKWRRVRNIGNAVLLLGYRTCEFLSLENVRLDEWEINHVFYDTDTYLDIEDDGMRTKIKMAGLEFHSVKEVPISWDFDLHTIRKPSWFTPSLY